NCSPEGIDLVIPGNDDALRAIRLFASRIADAIIEGRQVGTEGGTAGTAAAVGEEAGEGQAVPQEIGSLTAIPMEYLSEDERAEIESADIPDEEEEDTVSPEMEAVVPADEGTANDEPTTATGEATTEES